MRKQSKKRNKALVILSLILFVTAIALFATTTKLYIGPGGYVSVGVGSKVIILGQTTPEPPAENIEDSGSGGSRAEGRGGSTPPSEPATTIPETEPEQPSLEQQPVQEQPVQILTEITIPGTDIQAGVDALVALASLLGAALALTVRETVMWEVLALIEDEEKEELAEEIEENITEKEAGVIEKIREQWNSFRRMLPR